MFEGQIDFTFFSVADPHGLAGLLKSVIKYHEEILKKAEEQDKNDMKEITDKQKNLLDCQKCGTQNPMRSKFCNKCGAKLSSTCTKCGADNPDESSFCNKCGFTLK